MLSGVAIFLHNLLPGRCRWLDRMMCQWPGPALLIFKHCLAQSNVDINIDCMQLFTATYENELLL